MNQIEDKKMPSSQIRNSSLAALNTIQKGGLVSFLLLTILVALLHNPFDGYEFDRTNYWITKKPKPNACTKVEIEESESLYGSGVDFDIYVKTFRPVPGSENWTENDKWQWKKKRMIRDRELYEKCFDEVRNSTVEFLEFSDWRSKSPIVNWLGPIIHLLGTTIAIFLSLAIWLFVFQNQPKNNTTDE